MSQSHASYTIATLFSLWFSYWDLPGWDLVCFGPFQPIITLSACCVHQFRFRSTLIPLPLFPFSFTTTCAKLSHHVGFGAGQVHDFSVGGTCFLVILFFQLYFTIIVL